MHLRNRVSEGRWAVAPDGSDAVERWRFKPELLTTFFRRRGTAPSTTPAGQVACKRRPFRLELRRFLQHVERNRPTAWEVEIRKGHSGPGHVQTVVSDTGKGIDPEIMPRLFDAFFTTKSDEMGMGLAIVRSIIGTHGGRVWPRLNPDQGTSLILELPTNDEEQQVR